MAFLLFTRVHILNSYKHYLLLPSALLILWGGASLAFRHSSRRNMAVALSAGLLTGSALTFASVFIPRTAQLLPVIQKKLAPRPLYPEQRPDLEEIQRLLTYLEAQTRPGETVYVLASSEVLNSSLLEHAPLSLGLPGPRSYQVCHSPGRDNDRGSFPRLLFEADYILVGDPVQTHLQKGTQNVVTVPAAQLLTGEGFGRAYLDMGDDDGARQILEEVIAEGSDDLKIEARALLERIGR